MAHAEARPRRESPTQRPSGWPGPRASGRVCARLDCLPVSPPVPLPLAIAGTPGTCCGPLRVHRLQGIEVSSTSIRRSRVWFVRAIASNMTCWATSGSLPSAYYGIHTLRARENFPITGIAISAYPDLVNALAAVKQAAAAANRDLGLPRRTTRPRAILAACEEIRVRTAARAVRRRRHPGRRRHLGQHERQRGRRQSGAGASRPRARRVRGPASARRRQHGAEHERRLPDGGESRAALGRGAPAGRDGRSARRPSPPRPTVHATW